MKMAWFISLLCVSSLLASPQAEHRPRLRRPCRPPSKPSDRIFPPCNPTQRTRSKEYKEKRAPASCRGADSFYR
jgi:hypothetical protein